MMKELFNPGRYSNKINIVILLNRVVIASFMLVHGLSKLSTLMGSEPVAFADPLGIGATSSLVLAVFAEVLCSIFLMVGLAIRVMVVPLITTMLIAVLRDYPANEGELRFLVDVTFDLRIVLAIHPILSP